MIYLNNAGTSWPKPPAVPAAVNKCNQASPMEWGALYEDAFQEVVSFFGVPDPSRFLFTGSCTSALSLALAELPWGEGDRILTSVHDHHALSRWALKLKKRSGVLHTNLPITQDSPLDLEVLEKELKQGGVKLVACTMASNITGELLPYEEIIRLAHEHGALVLLDGAQTAGVIPIDLKTLGADLFVFAGHKGPLAPLGIGGFYAAPGVQMELPPAACGPASGNYTGVCSMFPSYCDVGSVNTSAAAGLGEGLRFLNEEGLDNIRLRTISLTERLLRGLENIPGVIIHGHRDASRRTAAVSITHESIMPADLEQELRENSEIITRAGYHCSPLAHEALGTLETGTLRLSSGPFTTEQDIDRTLEALSLASRVTGKTLT